MKKKLALFLGFLAILVSITVYFARQMSTRLSEQNSAPSQDRAPVAIPSQARGQAGYQTPDTQTSPRYEELASASVLKFLEERSAPGWTLQYSPDGKITSILGGEIREVGKSRESALAFARELAANLGIDANQIAPIPESENLTHSSMSTSFHFEQKVNGYDVYGGTLSLIAKKNDGSVFLINNNLKNVGAFKTTPLIGAEEAKSRLISLLQDRQPEITQKHNEAVIWTGPTHSELAWVFAARVSHPKYDQLEILVSAETGQVLFETSRLSH